MAWLSVGQKITGLFCLAVIGVAIAATIPRPDASSKLSPNKPAEVVDITGIYESSFGFVCTIKKPNDNVYVLRSTGGELGIGRLRGNFVYFGYSSNTVKSGLAVYQIEFDGKEFKLVGQWSTVPGNGDWTDETLVRIKGYTK